MMYYRRKVELALLGRFGGELSAKQFQKLLFLFTRKQDVKSYDFVPFRYGCYSFQASQDLHVLDKQGFVSIIDSPNGHNIFLIDKTDFYSTLTIFDANALDDTFREFSGMTQDELIRYTYLNYPFYATKSSVLERILSCEEIEVVKRLERHSDAPMLFTIGYEGLSLEKYVDRLIVNDVHVLCDVRKNAYSQKYGFSKAQLSMACEGVGIHYVHMPGLGIEPDKRRSLETQADYDVLFDEYEKTTLVDNFKYVLDIRSIIENDKRVALTCFEADPLQCHRLRVANALMGLDNKEYNLINLING